MKKSKKVVFHVMRHGDKSNNLNNNITYLTDAGVKMVMEASNDHLFGIEFDLVCCSDKIRTLQTAFYAMCAIKPDFNWQHILSKPAFGYDGAPDLNRYVELTQVVKARMAAENRPETIGLWHEVAPEMISFLATRIYDELHKVSMSLTNNGDLWLNEDKDEYNVFVASHSPTAELGVLTISPNQPTLKEADIIRYVFTVTENDHGTFDAEVTSATHLPRT